MTTTLKMYAPGGIDATAVRTAYRQAKAQAKVSPPIAPAAIPGKEISADNEYGAFAKQAAKHILARIKPHDFGPVTRTSQGTIPDAVRIDVHGAVRLGTGMVKREQFHKFLAEETKADTTELRGEVLHFLNRELAVHGYKAVVLDSGIGPWDHGADRRFTNITIQRLNRTSLGSEAPHIARSAIEHIRQHLELTIQVSGHPFPGVKYEEGGQTHEHANSKAIDVSVALHGVPRDRFGEPRRFHGFDADELYALCAQDRRACEDIRAEIDYLLSEMPEAKQLKCVEVRAYARDDGKKHLIPVLEAIIQDPHWPADLKP